MKCAQRAADQGEAFAWFLPCMLSAVILARAAVLLRVACKMGGVPWPALRSVLLVQVQILIKYLEKLVQFVPDAWHGAVCYCTWQYDAA